MNGTEEQAVPIQALSLKVFYLQDKHRLQSRKKNNSALYSIEPSMEM